MIENGRQAGAALGAWLRQPVSPWFIAIGDLIFIILGSVGLHDGSYWAAAFCAFVIAYTFVRDIVPAIRKSNQL